MPNIHRITSAGNAANRIAANRVTYEISGQTLILRRIGTHDILGVESR